MTIWYCLAGWTVISCALGYGICRYCLRARRHERDQFWKQPEL